ncbi:MAG: CpaF family protein [Blastocatellia bacterium]|nr:CpaF family protein [Blastocatellia bacterium]
MALRERLIRDGGGTAALRQAAEDAAGGKPSELQEMKARLHRAIINKMDLTKLNLLTPAQTHSEVARIARELLATEETPLSMMEREQLIEEIRHELFGLGPLEILLSDPTISDILVNSPYRIFVERAGKLERANVSFNDNEHVMRVIERIVSSVGRRIDESSPMVDARLLDGSRVNAVIPPIALDGPMLSIRRFGKIPLRMESLIERGALTREIADMLRMCVRARLNIVISGGTGAGKTTLLNALSAFIPEDERIITIEDSAELMLQQPHVARMETRPRNIEGKGEITQRELVKNALRMRPDRIVIGEVRAGEAIDMLQAMNTGHDGSLTTIHANTPRDALTRIETMIQMAGLRLSERAMRQQITSAINLVIQVSRLSDGTRRVTSICEILGIDRREIAMQELFRYERVGVDETGRVQGSFKSAGVLPSFAEKLEAAGMKLPPVLLGQE